MNFYRAHLTSSSIKGRTYDTTVELVRYKDTLIHFKDRLIIPAKLDSASKYKVYNICRDSIVTMSIPLIGDSSLETDSIHPVRYVMADTVYDKKEPKEEPVCENKWEISIEAGNSWNSIPRLNDPVQHTQTNGGQLAATFEISRFLASWFQLGLSGAYIILSYQDDIGYPGHVAGTYNTVYLGKPIIPIQLFGKFNFGKPVGLAIEYIPKIRIFSSDERKNRGQWYHTDHEPKYERRFYRRIEIRHSLLFLLSYRYHLLLSPDNISTTKATRCL